jgi:hypothetical protein
VQNNSTVQALGAAANKANAERFAANIIPIIREIQASGVTTLRGVARALNARGVQTRDTHRSVRVLSRLWAPISGTTPHMDPHRTLTKSGAP